VAAGTTLGTGDAPAPAQSLWYLGGPATLRGFGAGEVAGPDFARARLEVGNEFPGARIALFSDAGWAGDFDLWTPDDLALSVGVGGSLLDGLLRLDLSRTLQPVERWRLDFYLDALF
jgi:outer membrane protein assembly factor BamA